MASTNKGYTFESRRRMTIKEQTAFDMGYEIGKSDAVKHGQWISLTECANAGVYCSVCNKKVYKEDYAWCNNRNKMRSNYCPNCGAKMEAAE